MRQTFACLDVLSYIPHIPDLDAAVLTARRKPFTLTMESHRRHVPRMRF